jgi:hypothetical protein
MCLDVFRASDTLPITFIFRESEDGIPKYRDEDYAWFSRTFYSSETKENFNNQR